MCRVRDLITQKSSAIEEHRKKNNHLAEANTFMCKPPRTWSAPLGPTKQESQPEPSTPHCSIIEFSPPGLVASSKASTIPDQNLQPRTALQSDSFPCLFFHGFNAVSSIAVDSRTRKRHHHLVRDFLMNSTPAS